MIIHEILGYCHVLPTFIVISYLEDFGHDRSKGSVEMCSVQCPAGIALGGCFRSKQKLWLVDDHSHLPSGK